MATIKLLAAAIAVMGLASAGATSASAQSGQAGCDSRSKIISALDKEYKEAPVGIGLTQTGRVIELLVSSKGSWTLLATGPTGVSCLLAAGDNWEGMAIPVGEKS